MKAVSKVTAATVEVVPVADIFSNEFVARWLKFLGRTEKTNATYTMVARQMFKYFAANGIVQPTRSDLENWRDSLINAQKSPSTIRLYITTAKIFFRFLAQENLYPNIADRLQCNIKISHNHKRGALSAMQSAQLFKAVKGDTLKAKQLRAILALALSTGARAIEFERACVRDIRRENGILFWYVFGKGHSAPDACVRLDKQVYRYVQENLL